MTNLLELLNSIVFILFPFLCYIIYIAYCNDINKKESNLLLSVVLFASMYISAKQKLIDSSQYLYPYPILMFNIPLLIAYMRDKYKCAVMMSIFIIFNYATVFGLNIVICILEYLLYFAVFKILSKFKNPNTKYIYILLFCTIKITMCTTILSLSITDSTIITRYLVLIVPFIFSTILIVNLLEKSERVINLNITIKELEREKQLRNSLFNIAHEIKNPLAVCKGYLEMMDFKNKNHEKYIPIIQNELKRSVTLMNDMLNMTKIKIEPDYMDINVLLEDIMLCIKPLIRNKNIKIKMRLAKNEMYIYADYTRLKHVFIDIIKNSIESLNKTKREKVINIDVTLKKNKILTTIKDNGVGMTKQELKQMNMPYYIPDSKNKALGLTLSNEIIKCHKGEIEYFSKENKGTIAIITLPKIVLNKA